MSFSLEAIEAFTDKGKWSEALILLEDLITTLKPNQRLERIACLNEKSNCLIVTENLTKAKTCAQEALQLAEQMPLDQTGQAYALFNLGRYYLWTGESERAEECLQRSFTLRKEIGDPKHISNSLYRLGQLYTRRGELKRAKKFLQQGLSIVEKCDNRCSLIIAILYDLGDVYKQQGELERAEKLFQRGFTIAKEIGDIANSAICLNRLAEVKIHYGEWKHAEELLQKSLLEYEEISYKSYISETWLNLLRVYLTQNELEKISILVDRLTHKSQIAEYAEEIVLLDLARGLLEFKQHQYNSALNYAFQAKNRAAKIPHFRLQVESMYLLLQIHLQLYIITKQTKYKSQLESLAQELQQFSKREHLHWVYIETLLVQGFQRRTAFKLPEAIKEFEKAELLATERGFHLLAHKARAEINQLQNQVHQLQQLMALSPQAYEQIQLQAMGNYIEGALLFVKQVETELATGEKEEETKISAERLKKHSENSI
ncbi:MAG: tetratricopeptide repeat protein [Promethearchaeota archaeon]